MISLLQFDGPVLFAVVCVILFAGLVHGTHGGMQIMGRKAVQNVLTHHEMHATVLHLLGLDHEELTYRHNGIDRRLTNVHGHVIRDILT